MKNFLKNNYFPILSYTENPWNKSQVFKYCFSERFRKSTIKENVRYTHI